ncbi:MAG: alpha/beta hydrolase [Paracoccaceae bacterium]
MKKNRIASKRLETDVFFCGADGGVPVIFVHGNLSGAVWWAETMRRLPEGFRGIAPDLRGYGGADPAAVVDATRGMGDFSDDLAALMDVLGIKAAHVVGHSLGGGVLWRFLADHPSRVLSLTQVAPASPYGFGAVGPEGGPAFADGAGSGAAAVNPDFVRLMMAGAKGTDSPSHPLSVLNAYVWKPPFVPAEIATLLDAALAQHLGDHAYPGDSRRSSNWPGGAPGIYGPINALSPLYHSHPLAFTRIARKPPILWIRGADDPVVADGSLFDIGTLGAMGAVPGWPGADIMPPQLMIDETEEALGAYAEAGGRVETSVLEDCGHSPYLERPAAFDAVFHAFLRG